MESISRRERGTYDRGHVPKVRWVMSYGFCSKFRTLSNNAKNKNRLRFDKITDNLKVETV